MKDLRLTLKKIYFQMWKDGVKKEDYRNFTPYWAARLCAKYDIRYCFDSQNKIFCGPRCAFFKAKQYDRLVLTEGYPSKTETTRILYKHTPIINDRISKKRNSRKIQKMYFGFRSKR